MHSFFRAFRRANFRDDCKFPPQIQISVRCLERGLQFLDQVQGMRQPSPGASIASDTGCAPIFPPSGSKLPISEPLAHGSSPYSPVCSASARQSSSVLAQSFSTASGKPMPSEFSHESRGHKFPAEPTLAASAAAFPSEVANCAYFFDASGRRMHAASRSLRTRRRSPLRARGFHVLSSKMRMRPSSFAASGVGRRRTISPGRSVICR